MTARLRAVESTLENEDRTDLSICLNRSQLNQIESALNHAGSTKGLTHNFYSYPARFSPEFARTIISIFSNPGDWILDPFMGGGTSIVEGIAHGRRMIGIDINTLAHFVSNARTTPLSSDDARAIRNWVKSIVQHSQSHHSTPHPIVRNLPQSLGNFLSNAILEAESKLRYPRRQAFARCALLRLGQWAVDCRESSEPDSEQLCIKLNKLVNSMLLGIENLVEVAQEVGIPKNKITGYRTLICGSTLNARKLAIPEDAIGRIGLVVTSPPYPQVHILYHRWQVRGRRETPAPYWIARVPDEHGESYYTFGGRSRLGQRKYFNDLLESYKAIRPMLARDAVIIQLVSFSHPEEYLPLFLNAMKNAGYREISIGDNSSRLLRKVPNRKWYVRTGTNGNPSVEMLLAHRVDH